MNHSDIKHNHNIVDYIGRFVNLKKAGANYFGRCPFHDEKSPSFSVNENKQFFHCFGCGAQGDIIEFAMKYHGFEFMDAIKELGGDVNGEKPEYNPFRFRPANHNNGIAKKDDPLVIKFLNTCERIKTLSGDVYIKDEDAYALIINADGHKIGVCSLGFGEYKYLNGFRPLNGFTPIRKNNTRNFIICRDYYEGVSLAKERMLNVAVCYGDESLNFHYPWPSESITSKPLLTPNDSDALMTETGYLWLEDGKLTKREKEIIKYA